MKQSGSSDLALMGGHIPSWLFDRMVQLSRVMVEAILVEYGHQAFLSRLSDPFWFQSFGAVIGMDWNSSGVTTAVMRALQQSVNPVGKELGLYVCGGKGNASRRTPDQLRRVGDQTGLDAEELVRSSKLSAKVDNTAVQDGFQLYLHHFVVSDAGDWSIVQQGMRPKDHRARRYHWHSAQVESFVEEPHAAVCGDHQGEILNLVAKDARPTREGILDISGEGPEHLLKELPKMVVPLQKGIRPQDINMKRLEGILRAAQETHVGGFEDLLLLKGMGPRTLQSLTLISEVIHGTPSRFSDPARYAFAHGSKGGNPFPVPTKVYDETISTLRKSVEQAKMGHSDKQAALKKLGRLAARLEEEVSEPRSLDSALAEERMISDAHGGRTVERRPKPKRKRPGEQLDLFGDG